MLRAVHIKATIHDSSHLHNCTNVTVSHKHRSIDVYVHGGEEGRHATMARKFARAVEGEHKGGIAAIRALAAAMATSHLIRAHGDTVTFCAALLED